MRAISPPVRGRKRRILPAHRRYCFFRINVLALNAAVEAARAGEQDAGSRWWLAKSVIGPARSAQAAREIKSLIEDSVSRVDVGSTPVESAGETMDEIVNAESDPRDRYIMGDCAPRRLTSKVVVSTKPAVAEMDRVTQAERPR